MARQTINNGHTPGDGTGEELFYAFQKANNNFLELYNLAAQALAMDANGNVNVPGALAIGGKTVLNGPIQPVANAASGQEATQLNALLANMRAAGLLASSSGPSLAALSLSSATITTGSAQGTVVGNIVGLTAGSTPSLFDNASGRFAIAGNAGVGYQVVAGSVATNISTATSHSITIREVLANAQNSPRDTVLNITVAQAPVTLVPLSLSSANITSGSAQGTVVGNVIGLTAGSTPTLTNSAGSRFALTGNPSSGYQIVAGSVATNYSTATSHSITISEALAGATNTPKSTTLTITVAQASVAPTITSVTISNTTPTVGDVLTASVTATGNPTPTLTYQWKAAGSAIVGATSSAYTVQSGDATKTITVTVTASNGVGSNATLTSAATSAVAAATQTVNDMIYDATTAAPGTDFTDGSNVTSGGGISQGVNITINTSGTLTAVKFWRSSASQSAAGSVGVWRTDDASNSVMGLGDYASQSGTGWVTVPLATPISVTAGQKFTVGYWQSRVSGNVFYRYAPSTYPLQSQNAGFSATEGFYSYSDNLVQPFSSASAESFSVDAVLQITVTGTGTSNPGGGAAGDYSNPPAILTAWPSASNTGVPAGTTLTPTAGYDENRAGVTVSGKDFTSQLYISASNVTIKNCRFAFSSPVASLKLGPGVTGVTIMDCTFDGRSGSVGTYTAISGDSGNWTASILRCNIGWVENGFSLDRARNVLVQDCYIHDLLGDNPSNAHYDGIECNGNVAGVWIRHCWIDNPFTQSSGILIDNYSGAVDQFKVDGCYIKGGGYNVFIDNRFTSSAMTNISVINCTLIKGSNNNYFADYVGITTSGNSLQ